MVSLTTASNYFLALPYSFTYLNIHAFPSWPFVFNPRRRVIKQERFVSLNIVAAERERGRGGPFLGFVEGKRNYRNSCGWCGGFLRRCIKDLDIEGDLALEAEIMQFMRNSENPEAFPSKKQLMDAGRMDLVEAIARQGGWLAFGWDMDDEDKEEQPQLKGVQGYEVTDWDLTMMKQNKNGVLQETIETGEKRISLEGDEIRRYGVSSFAVNSSGSASSSDKSLEEAIADDSGMEGILSRLEKERNINFGFGLREEGNSACVQSAGSKNDWHTKNSREEAVPELGRSGKLASLNPVGGIINNSGCRLTQNTTFSGLDGLKNSPKPEMLRTWSSQRAGFLDMEFEAAEIASDGGAMDVSGDDILELREGGNEHLNKQEKLNSCSQENNHNDIQSCLQELELELSSVLHTLRSNRAELPSQEGYEALSDDLHKLSDAWEFQENEIMNAQDRLRSVRAKLAVLEGKMALAIIDAQKVAKEKQKGIDDARRALRLIRTACIVWPNSASEVFLAGSFDGWTSQRKMEKSRTGIFSLYLKLYPGRYEIKFIVDGEWEIDPLRRTVHNNGHENNLLIIT